MVVPNAAYAAKSATGKLEPWSYTIRDPLEDEVLIKVKYSGICHSDIHTARSEWGPTVYPTVPGHEFTGIVVKAGESCKRYKVGDAVGVGCIVNSCRKCDACAADEEHLCAGAVRTYRGETRGERTFGGYGKYVVCREEYVFRIPAALPLDQAAPLLCAGITTYSPIMAHNMNRGGLKIGVIGLGGLGHMAVQFAAAFGNEVWVISRSNKKEELALELGAKGIIPVDEIAKMDAHKASFNYLIDTVATDKPMARYLALLRAHGILVTVGLPPSSLQLTLPPSGLILGNKGIFGSGIGGIKETQEMLDFCAEKSILPMIEKIPCDYVNEAYDRVVRGDVLFRFVLDVEQTCPTVPAAPF